MVITKSKPFICYPQCYTIPLFIQTIRILSDYADKYELKKEAYSEELIVNLKILFIFVIYIRGH